MIFEAGQSSVTVRINISDDNIVEDTERFHVLLSSTDSSVFIAQDTVTVDIVDTDGIIAINIKFLRLILQRLYLLHYPFYLHQFLILFSPPPQSFQLVLTQSLIL